MFVASRVARHVVGHEELAITQNTSVFIKHVLGWEKCILGDFFFSKNSAKALITHKNTFVGDFFENFREGTTELLKNIFLGDFFEHFRKGTT